MDIDGVLLGKHSPDQMEVVLARHAKEFLEYCVQNFECYWLTTHCQDGDATKAVRWLKPNVDAEVMKLANAIKPTSWKTLKTEAINFSSDFYWIDDELLWSEVELLKKNNVLSRWIRVNTYKYPDDLERAMAILNDCRGQTT